MKTVILYIDFKSGEHLVFRKLNDLCDQKGLVYKTIQRNLSGAGVYVKNGIIIKKMEVM